MNEMTAPWWERLWQFVKAVWFRTAVLMLLSSLVAGFWLEWREEQSLAVKRLETEYNAIQPLQDQWLNASTLLVSEAARPGARYPEPASLLPLREAVRSTLDAMTAIYAPSGRLATSASDYRNALADVAGSINQYTPSDAGMERLLEALQTASNLGGQYAADVDEYRTEAWHSYWSIIF